MKTIIVYTSKTGFTKKYAQLIALHTQSDIIELKSASAGKLAQYDRIVYGGRLFAGTIDGLKKIRKLLNGDICGRLVVFATGAAPNAAEDVIQKMWAGNLSEHELTAVPHYYMQAGLCYEKMAVIEKFMMKIAAKAVSSKKEKTAEEEDFARAISSSFDIWSEEYAMPLIGYLNNN